MAQINLYVPDDLEKRIKNEARLAKKSVSAFVLDLVQNKLQPQGWSDEFAALMKSPPTDIPEVSDLPLQDRKDFEDL